MLTAKQELFARKIVEGLNQSDAYRAAYSCNKMSDKTIWENASRLMADSKVISRVVELRKEISMESVMTAQERLEWLTEVIKDKDEKTENKLKAADIMNRMQGVYVQRVAADVQTETTINIELVDE